MPSAVDPGATMTSLTPNIAPIRLLQTVGITSAALLGGMGFACSLIGIPTIMMAPPSLAVKQWAQTNSIESKIAPAISILSMGSFAYLAYHNYQTYSNSAIIYSPFSDLWKGYLAAGALAFAIIPYTMAVMCPGTIKRLHNIHDEEHKGLSGGKTATTENTHDLLEKFAGHNLVKGCLSTAGAVVGCWTSLRLNL